MPGAKRRPNRAQAGRACLLRRQNRMVSGSVGSTSFEKSRIDASGMKPLFSCPHCGALYHLVKGEAGPETVYREIKCRICGGPLPEREGEFVLKYFLLRKALPRDTRAFVGSQHRSVRAVDAK